MDVLTDLGEEFLLTLGSVSSATKTVYARSIRQFRTFLAEKFPQVSEPEQLERRHVDSWMQALTDSGRSEATRRVRLIAVRLWFDYLTAEPDIPLTANPAARVALPTPKDHVVPVVADDDLAALLAACSGSSFLELRDTALLRVLIDTGCRRGEVVGIDVDDVDLRVQDITLRRTKGGNQRTVPVGSRTALALRKYLRARARHAGAADPALFLSTRTSGGRDGWRMSGDGVAAMLRRRCRMAGLPDLHPHQLRHTWAHDQLANGAQESDVERLAGWRSPTMIRRYGASAASQRARDAARRLARGDRV